ncbi:MAG: CbiX/SirB N-terminal domain-containing protein [Candidatus Omnitrophota bacterium]|nr:CbiX/SirB N-terminal domain-containing protein [Candidatus Omnitrophota bacterium]
MSEKQVVIILNHGTRHKQAQKDFSDFILNVRNSLPAYHIEQASMEMSKPNLPDVVEKLYKENVRKIAVVPFFLFSGMHLSKDIPRMLESLRTKYENLEIVQGRPLVLDERLCGIMIDRIKEVLA